MYETNADRANESAIARSFLQATSRHFVELRKLPARYEFDFAVVSSITGDVNAMIEAKARRQRHEQVMLSMTKFRAGVRYAEEGLQSFLVMAIPDRQGVRRLYSLAFQPGIRPDRFAWGGRDGRAEMREPLAMIALGRFMDHGPLSARLSEKRAAGAERQLAFQIGAA